MRPLSLSVHIRSQVSALVDGQLPPAEAERAWAHVLTCPGCRHLVQREGWTKHQLAGLAGPAGPAERSPHPSLQGRLYGLAPDHPAYGLGRERGFDPGAWAGVDRLEHAARRRRTTVVMAGAGSLGAAVIGLVALTVPPVSQGERPAPAMVRTDLGGAQHRTTPRTGPPRDRRH